MRRFNASVKPLFPGCARGRGFKNPERGPCVAALLARHPCLYDGLPRATGWRTTPGYIERFCSITGGSPSGRPGPPTPLLCMGQNRARSRIKSATRLSRTARSSTVVAWARRCRCSMHSVSINSGWQAATGWAAPDGTETVSASRSSHRVDFVERESDGIYCTGSRMSGAPEPRDGAWMPRTAQEVCEAASGRQAMHSAAAETGRGRAPIQIERILSSLPPRLGSDCSGATTRGASISPAPWARPTERWCASPSGDPAG